MESFNILLVTQEYGKIYTGGGTYAASLSEGLIKRGHKVSIMCPKEGIPEYSNMDFLSVKRSMAPLSYDIAKKLKTIYKDFDIVHFTDARMALFFVYSRDKREGARIIGTIHDFYSAIARPSPIFYAKDYPYDWPSRLLYYNMNKWKEKMGMQRLDRLIGVCNYTANQIINSYGIDKEKVDVVYNGIDSQAYSHQIDSLWDVMERRPNKSPALLYVGANYQRKGLRAIIKSAPNIVERFPSAKFFIVGYDPHMEKFRETVKRLGLKDHFEFLGNIEKEYLYQLFTSSDLFIMPSLYESFSFALLEAMSFGTPPIAGNVGGSDELITHEENGLLVDPHNHESLSRCICDVLQDEKKWKKMSKDCKETVKKFNIERMVDETVEVYKRGLNKY